MAEAQQQAGQVPCPVVVTGASEERFWGGPNGVFWAAAPFQAEDRTAREVWLDEAGMTACVVKAIICPLSCIKCTYCDTSITPTNATCALEEIAFEGRHAWEPPAIAERALRTLQSRTIYCSAYHLTTNREREGQRYGGERERDGERDRQTWMEDIGHVGGAVDKCAWR